MTPKKKQKPVWITIPEKNQAKKSTQPLAHPDEVNHKFFWALGFVAVLFFGFILAMPNTFSSLMKGDLFDGQLQLVPEGAGESGGAFFGGGEAEEFNLFGGGDETENSEVTDNGVQTSNSEAELIDIQPVTTPSTTNSVEVEPVSETETVQTESTTTSLSTEMQALIADLNAQLAALRQQALEKDQEIQALNQRLEQEIVLRNAAEAQSVQVPTSTTIQTSQTSNLSNSSTTPNGYRVNTHTVAMSPEDILAQAQTAGSNSNAQLQANVFDAEGSALNLNSPQAPSEPAPTTDFSDLQSQPTTGPLDSMAFAFLLAALGVLAYGSYRQLRVV